ncbi:VTT domain-containing protein [Streptomyces sp. ODS28]|uniref:DedA family protein n=1 Tax=Streptomyces sp. ODS28 TaxID=3136688 RepID=UPI0031E886C6
MNVVPDVLAHVPPSGAYALVAVAVLAESVLLVGAFVPTLTLLLTAGGLARTGQLSLAGLIATAACAVVAGDLLGHRTGRVLGVRVRTGRLGRRLPAPVWRRAEVLMERRGGQAVFLGRFLPVIRTVTPHLAGAARLPYRRIAPYSLAAAGLWAAAEVGTGYAAAASFQQVLAAGGPALAAGVAAVASAAVACARAYGRRRAASARTAAVQETAAQSVEAPSLRERV